MEQKRVGTFTLGICLLVFGILFLIHLFIPSLQYLLIFHFWPIILIILGVEILFYSIKAPDKHYRYDFAAILIILLLVGFAMSMAGVEWMMIHVPENAWIQWY